MSEKKGLLIVFLVVCGLVLLALVAVGTVSVLWWLWRDEAMVSSEMQKMRMVQAEAHNASWADLARAFDLPSEDAGADRWFPVEVTEFNRASHDDRAAVAETGIDRPGRHATYRSSKGSLDLYIYRVSGEEAKAVHEQVKKAIKKKEPGYQFRQLDAPRYFGYSFGRPQENGVFWWDGGWLFLARTRHHRDPAKFLGRYLQAVYSSSGLPVSNKTPPG